MSKNLSGADLERYVRRREQSVSSMLNSNRVNVSMDGAFQAFGAFEIREDNALSVRLFRWFCVTIAKNLMYWTPEQIEASIELGRELERSVVLLEEQDEVST